MIEWLAKKERFENSLVDDFEKCYMYKKGFSKLHHQLSCNQAEAYLRDNEGWLQNLLMLYKMALIYLSQLTII
ncbi:MAG: hypothetical protein P8X74_17840 [Reinekea sp.]|jgi:hypothetical protein